MPLHFGVNTKVKFVYGDLNIKVRGVEEGVLFLDGLVRRSMNLSVPFQEFQKDWFESIQENFAAGGDPIPWPELSPAYAEVAHGGNRKPTERLSDRLYESLSSQTSDTIWHVGPRSIQFGTRVPYFEFQQEGTSRMPARPVLTLSDAALVKLLERVQLYLMQGAPK